MQIKVVPKKGQTVIDPVTKRAISEDGELVVSSTYWNRRLACGDVTLCEQKEEKKTEKIEHKSFKKESGGK
jgi:hypothetical protein